jgi:hypothetical protein
VGGDDPVRELALNGDHLEGLSHLLEDERDVDALGGNDDDTGVMGQVVEGEPSALALDAAGHELHHVIGGLALEESYEHGGDPPCGYYSHLDYKGRGKESQGDNGLPTFSDQQLDPGSKQLAAFARKDRADRDAFQAHWTRMLDDAAIIGDLSLPTELMASVTTPTLVLSLDFAR